MNQGELSWPDINKWAHCYGISYDVAVVLLLSVNSFNIFICFLLLNIYFFTVVIIFILYILTTNQ